MLRANECEQCFLFLSCFRFYARLRCVPFEFSRIKLHFGCITHKSPLETRGAREINPTNYANRGRRIMSSERRKVRKCCTVREAFSPAWIIETCRSHSKDLQPLASKLEAICLPLCHPALVWEDQQRDLRKNKWKIPTAKEYRKQVSVLFFACVPRHDQYCVILYRSKNLSLGLYRRLKLSPL